MMKSYKDVGCRNCGAVLPMELSNTPVESKGVWFPGKKCPMCGSQEFYPTIKPSEPADVKSKKEWRYNPYYGLVALAIVVILVPLWFFVIKRGSGEVTRSIVLICTKCDAISESEVSEKPPFRCPKCHEKTAYQALFCPNDWVIFPRKTASDNQTDFPPCPKCGSNKAGIVFKMGTVHDVKAKRKLYEEWEEKSKEKENAPK